MAVIIRHEISGWRPTWAQMLDIIDRFCRGDETIEELRWLRAHPTDWLMVATYMRNRTENHIAITLKRLNDIPVVDDLGHTTGEYRRAKAQAESLNGRRLLWIGKINEQIQEAKYILGYTKVPADVRASLVERLVLIRVALISDLWSTEDVIRQVGGLIRTYGDAGFDPDKYLPIDRGLPERGQVRGADDAPGDG